MELDWTVQMARNYFAKPAPGSDWRDVPNGQVGRVLIAENDRLIARVEELEAERDALKAENERLRKDGLTRLAVAENAPPSNMRLGQVREIRWWMKQLDKAALAQSPQTGGDHA